MFKTQKPYEETVTVYNQLTPVRASGGIATIPTSSSTTMKAVMLPDSNIYRENRKEGQFFYERVFAQVRKDEINRVSIIPGKTRIEWNGYTYVVYQMLDYTSKKLFQNAEIELRRRLGFD